MQCSIEVSRLSFQDTIQNPKRRRPLLSFSSKLRWHLHFFVLFDITSEQSVELKWLMLKQTQKMIPLITCEISLGQMSASWFLVSMCLIWILESKLIRSNNQSSATLWVLETCLIVGLLPSMIILITASLSSNTYNKAS